MDIKEHSRVNPVFIVTESRVDCNTLSLDRFKRKNQRKVYRYYGRWWKQKKD